MCARRFLIAVLILTLLLVAGAFAIFQWGGDVLLKSAPPTGHFRAAAAGGAPDYSKAEAWIARPDIANNPSEWLPDPPPDLMSLTGATVFYIHPTTYLERDRWNAPLRP